MKKNNPDAGSISDLLKKLHASYFGTKEEPEKPKKKVREDREDEELLDQLKATLDRATDTADEKTGKKKAKKEKRSAKAEDAPIEIEEQAPEQPTAANEPAPLQTSEPDEPSTVCEASVSPTTKKKSSASPKSPKKATRKVPAPIESEVVAEPMPEAPIDEERTEEDPTELQITKGVDELTEESEAQEILEESISAETLSLEETALSTEETAPTPPKAPTVKRKIVKKIIKKPVEIRTDSERAESAKDDAAQSSPSVEQEEASKEPIVPTQVDGGDVSIPRISSEYDFTKERYPDKEDSIVISPKVKSAPPAESIVIRPRVNDYKPPRPTVTESATATPPPITIHTMQEKKKTTVNESTAAPVKELESTEPIIEKAEPSPAQKEEEATPTTEKKTRQAPTAAKTVRRRPLKVPPPSVTAPTEEESFNEVLEATPTELLEEPILEEIPAEEPEAIHLPQDGKRMSIFRRRQLQKQAQEEQTMSVSELIQKRSGLTDDDIAMMFELGYENELGKLVGYETVKKLRCEHMRKNSRMGQAQTGTSFGYRGTEYVGKKQNGAVLVAYSHDKKRLIHRLFLTALLTIVAFFADLPMLLGGYAEGIVSKYPFLPPLVGILCLCLAALLSAKQLLAGGRSLLHFTPTAYSTATLTVPLALLYELINLIVGTDRLAVSFLCTGYLLLTTVCDAFRLCTELRSFRLLSANEPKTVLEVTTPHKKKLRSGNKIIKVISEDNGDTLYRVRTATQATGFFRRFNNMESHALPFGIFVCVAASAAFLIAFFTAILTHSFFEATEAFMTVWFVSVPCLLLLNFFYPIFRANALLARRSCTLVGEESIGELGEDHTVIFNDTDLFTAKKRAQLSVCDGVDLRRDIRLADAIFYKMGGTLAGLVGTTAKSKLDDTSVAFVRIMTNGVEAVVDNQYHVLLGNADFLRRSGIRVPAESTDMMLRRPHNVSLMYVAIDGALKLSYEIEYNNDQGFEDTVLLLALDGVSVSVHSLDPNLTDAFLHSCRRTYEDPVGVVRPGRFDGDKTQEMVDTGAVALGERGDISLPIHAAKCIKEVRHRGLWLQIAASALGIAASTVLTVLGMTQYITPVSVALYQCAWLAISFIGARLHLSRTQLNL